jgi:hypothetical protein
MASVVMKLLFGIINAIRALYVVSSPSPKGQEQGGPLTHQGSGFPFRRLLLSGATGEVFDPPPHGNSPSKYKLIEVML